MGVNSIEHLELVCGQHPRLPYLRRADRPDSSNAVCGTAGHRLNWIEPETGNIDEWIHWDDGVNAGNSIGTGGSGRI